MMGFNAVCESSRITWIEQEHGWAATPEEIRDRPLERGLRGMQA
jgi:hypothetical protein